MAIRLREELHGRIIIVQASGKLTKDDYRLLVPRVEERIQEYGGIRLVFEMVDFHGWHAGALLEDMKFDLRHFADIERLALVGETRWQKAMGIFCKPFTKAEIRYFDLNDIDEAYAWIRAGLEETAIS